MIKQRISAGAIILKDGKVLLVHHHQENEFDFWVMPGGGAEGDEGILKAAEREVLEETSLTVRAERIAYIEELIDGDRYVCKFWVYCSLMDGILSTEHKDADEDFLKGAGFFSRDEIGGLNVFPAIMKDVFWDDLETGFSSIKYLGYHRD